ncbi:MAG: hypothetical protein ACOX4F_08575 [Atopobiaceae bacterium]|jgi:hypothetical protein
MSIKEQVEDNMRSGAEAQLQGDEPQRKQPPRTRFRTAVAWLGGRALLSALALVLVAALGALLTPADPTNTKGVLYPYMYGYSKLVKNSMDVLIAGDSSAMCGLSPAVLKEETQLSSYNAACPRQSIETSSDVIRNVWQYQTPKYVVLDVNNLFTETGSDLAIKEYAARVFPLLRNHTNWKLLLQGKLGAEGANISSDLGYYPSSDVVACTNTSYMQTGDAPTEIPAATRIYLEDIQRICAEHGATLVLVNVPNAAEWSQAKHDLVETWAEEHNALYFDANTDASVGIDWSQDTRDGGMHLNQSGATKATSWLANVLETLESRGNEGHDA